MRRCAVLHPIYRHLLHERVPPLHELGHAPYLELHRGDATPLWAHDRHACYCKYLERPLG